VGSVTAASTRDHLPAQAGATPRSPHPGCTPHVAIGLDPASVGVVMARADGGTRERLTSELQARYGNAAVQRMLAGSSSLAVQRWAVGLPAATTDCARVVTFMDANSPYRRTSGWAQTRARFTWGGDPAYTTTDGTTTATVSNPTVTPAVTVDMPVWAPSDPAMARAWSGMISTLRAHEAEHERIAARWESTLRSDLAALEVTVANRRIGTFRSAVQAQWDAWLAQHQADQTAIDPFTAILDCSDGGGAAAESAPISGLDDEPDLSGA
jgi:predicted secreted Zn-dependent protease